MFSDCHAHFSGFNADELNEVVKRSTQEEIEIVIVVSMDLESSIESVNIANTNRIIYSAVGIHPWNAATIDEDLYQKLKALASSNKVVAIGEIGLDFVGDLRYPERGLPDFSVKEVQKQALTEQMKLARELGKPAIIHNRGADEEIMDILRKEKGAKTVLHSFMGSEAMLEEAVDLGCYFSIGLAMLSPEIVSDTGKFHQMVKRMPVNRLLLETDTFPHSKRGVRMPWDVKRVAGQIAQLRGTTTEKIGMVTTSNLKRLLFGLDASLS